MVLKYKEAQNSGERRRGRRRRETGGKGGGGGFHCWCESGKVKGYRANG